MMGNAYLVCTWTVRSVKNIADKAPSAEIFRHSVPPVSDAVFYTASEGTVRSAKNIG